jgi:hypothetical protein
VVVPFRLATGTRYTLDSGEKEVEKMKQKIGYRVNEPYYDGAWHNGVYQHASIDICVKNEDEEYRNVLTLRYQRDRDNPDKTISRWYGESLDRLEAWRITEGLETATKIMKAVEKAYEKYQEKGLSIPSDDALHIRKKMLELSGAKQVYYSKERHGFYE